MPFPRTAAYSSPLNFFRCTDNSPYTKRTQDKFRQKDKPEKYKESHKKKKPRKTNNFFKQKKTDKRRRKKLRKI